MCTLIAYVYMNFRLEFSPVQENRVCGKCPSNIHMSCRNIASQNVR